MDDGRRVAVQVHQPAQDLPRPLLQHLLIDVLVPLAVPAQRTKAGRQAGRRSSGLLGCGHKAQAGTPPALRPAYTSCGRPAAAAALLRTHCLSVPLVKSSVMKLMLMFLGSSQES